ncbi:DNA repair protein RAD14, putative [Hepatocystis sp. ex Piliocolobus tephrosceles]|nr:DNA repair protein RAD14, putative [Hepatocystis sp. ex Piliocolobus tephrosceles]
MSDSDDSSNELENTKYNDILFEHNTTNDINYFDDRLPHINFYLKFQNKDSLQKFINESQKNKICQQIDSNCIGNTEENKNETNSNIVSMLDDSNEGGFCIEYDPLTYNESNFNEGNFNEGNYNKGSYTDITVYNKLIYYVQNASIDTVMHLEDNENDTKKLNTIFQKNKKQFIFSIERINRTNNLMAIQEYCFICNKKKKLNKILKKININVCYDCKMLDDNFRMISLSKLLNKYSLNSTDLLKYKDNLALLLMKNPHGYTKQMKLYFVFQIKEIAIRKHQSLEHIKTLYDMKIYNLGTNKSNNTTKSTTVTNTGIKKKKSLHQLKKPKSIYNNEFLKIMEKKKIICDNNEHDFYDPLCIDQQNNMYIKKCKHCEYQIELMNF